MSAPDHITQHTYDEIAPEFARVNATMPPDLLAALERFVALVGDNARVLDLGCGAGRDSAWMRTRGLTVIGVDFSMGMLTQAQASRAENLAQMDMLHVGFHVHCFQGVWCNAALLHLPKRLVPTVLSEIHRVLVRQGALFIAAQEGTTEGYEPNPYSMPSLERFFARYRQAEMQDLLSANDFTRIQVSVCGTDAKRWLHVFAVAE